MPTAWQRFVEEKLPEDPVLRVLIALAAVGGLIFHVAPPMFFVLALIEFPDD